ncbi:hypothetical protein A3F27_02540 [Candidatus Kaiserbacteria bacterium RIFCSPHIGHO2_12_FULL_53_13]|uniref:Uncharacterized protein n=1 Tax=Candidatus Kaiserbacteria bacterium RIFCSPHIGHO2_12_FULL_53_13 TaxID=1798502 RepID=A0A1F6EC30_9BACT|nr:MAG: hypothetical protein A3F27_02540 [Candidatus Kaiserbacteria bacterium RIFCSPHIGHO2_12_FULL_53_13]OGG74479.1 MAG: hypothetical protein A3A37_01425 [Candidatus Kaiserbacteria bacterium RIFCSPLOWO2_01_FULL_52_36]
MGRRKIHKPSIFQAQLQFPEGRGIYVLNTEHPLENAAFRTLLVIFLTLVFSYIYFVGASVLNIIARKEALVEATKLSSAIANFERDYFAMSQNVTPESGTALGLAPVSNTAYVYRPGAVGQIETPRNEI